MELNLFSMWNEIKKKHPMLQSAETGLLGEKTTTLPGQDTNRSGGFFGHGGTMDESLNGAGGKIGDYTQGKPQAVSPPSTYGTHRETQKRPGFEHSQAKKHLDMGMEGLYDTMKWGVETTDKVVNESLNFLFPNLDNNDLDVTKDEKETLAQMVKDGKVDHGFIKHLKNKNSPANEADIGTLEKFTGVSKEEAMKNWKDKGGFEGLMANPGFTLGLALMQSSAQGKSIGGAAMDNFIKAAGISEHYKDRIKARTNVLGPISKEERGLVDSAMASIGISGPGFWKGKVWDNVKLWGKDHEAMYNEGLNKIAAKAKKMINEKYKGKTHQITKDDYIWALNQLKKSGELQESKNWFSTGLDASGKERQRTSGLQDWLIKKAPWLKDSVFFRAEGGPVTAGQPYVVGEKGPEIIIPKEDGEVLSNDNSQIFAMLLAANPQLKNVSRARAEAILKSRFPDYFA